MRGISSKRTVVYRVAPLCLVGVEFMSHFGEAVFCLCPVKHGGGRHSELSLRASQPVMIIANLGRFSGDGKRPVT